MGLKSKKLWGSLLSAMMLISVLTPQAMAADGSGKDEGTLPCAQDQVIVEFAPEVTGSEAEDIVQDAGAEDVDLIDAPGAPGSEQFGLVTLEKGDTVESAADALEEQPEIISVQPNYAYALEENLEETKSAYNDADAEMQWYSDAVHAKQGWNVLSSVKHSKTRVAVLDTGINLGHEDLKGNINRTLSVDATTAKLPALKKDLVGHGTHVAGIIAATANNGKGIAGIAAGPDNSGVELIGVNVFEYVSNPKLLDGGDPGYYAWTDDIIRGMNYAAAKGAKVINMSLGMENYDKALKKTVSNLGSSKVTIVAAAGNDHNDILNYPADFSECISVTAINRDNELAYFSNYGPTKDLTAPGMSIYSTNRDGGYGCSSGTSFSAPIVSSAAAMLYSMKPGLTSSQVKSILYDSADDILQPGKDICSGYGRVNIRKALEKLKDFHFITKVDVARSSMKVKKGHAFTLNTKVLPSNASKPKLQWKSSNTKVATVSSTGKVTAKGGGTATITAVSRDGSLKSDQCKVTVLSVAKPTLTKVKRTGKTTGTLYFSKVSGAKGYEILYCKNSGFSPNAKYYRTARTVKTLRGLDSGKKYYFKVRAYKMDSYGKRVYGSYSNVKANM